MLAKTPAEFDAYLTSLFLDIAQDGVILHDLDGYISDRLARLRQPIEKKGLRRLSAHGNLVWRWKRFPGFDWSLDWDDVR